MNKKSVKPTWYGVTQCRHPYENYRNTHLFNKSVGFFLPQLTRKAFENFGFSTASLILEWPQIVGVDLASWTAPEEIKWPPKKPSGSSSSYSGEDAGPFGALLILRVDPAHILEVTYSSRQLIDRINSYFGYRAVAEVRLLSSPLNSTKSESKNRPHSQPRHTESPTTKALPHQDPLDKALHQLETHLKTSYWNQSR